MVLFFALEKQLHNPSNTASAVGTIAGLFFYVFVTSALIGMAFGMITCLLFKCSTLNKSSTAELFVILFMALGSFQLCEYLELSGIIAIFFCGIIQSHYTWNNLSDLGRVMTPRVFHAVASVSETFVFAYLGMACFAFSTIHDWNWGFIIVVILLCFGARAITIFSLTPCANLKRKRSHISWQQQVTLWFSGLRGAIAFALVIRMTDIEMEDGTVGTPYSALFMTTTLMVVIFTTILCGTFTAPLLRLLKLDKERDAPYHRSKKARRWKHIDENYLMPCLLLSERQGKTDKQEGVKLLAITDYSAQTRRAAPVLGIEEYDLDSPTKHSTGSVATNQDDRPGKMDSTVSLDMEDNV